MKLIVNSPNVRYTDEYIESDYVYRTTVVEHSKDDTLIATPTETSYTFRTEKKVPKLGVMLVGWGGNNGSTVTAAILANKYNMSFKTKNGEVQPNYFGSITQASSIVLGSGSNGQEVNIPMKNILPMVDPNDIVLDGWDISGKNMADAMARAEVLDINLQDKLRPYMEVMKPRPSVYYPDFIAANQSQRADNIREGTKQENLNHIRSDIRNFKKTSGVDKVIILWTANTERFSDIRNGLNDTAENLMVAIENNESEISQSTIFAVASILEGVTYINGSPQNTFVPAVIEMAEKMGVFIGGDDFKSGQTKLKSVLVDFLVSAGIKPLSIVSYNHLGNNDGMNLSVPQTFRSKEISKSNVVDDMVESSRGILYNNGEKPDHCVVIKYIPAVGDSKRAMDEYTSELMMGAKNTLVIHNTCEDSMLASPLILDLVIISELCERIMFKVKNQDFQKFHPVMSILSYLCKAPLVPKNSPLINALFRQRACIDNIFRACIGLSPMNYMLLEYKHSLPHNDVHEYSIKREGSKKKLGYIVSRDDHRSKLIGHGLING